MHAAYPFCSASPVHLPTPLKLQDRGLLELEAPKRDALGVHAMLAPSSLHVCLGRQASPFLLTAGMDRQIRFWDLHKPAASFCASGYAVDAGPHYQLGRPSFVAQQIMPAANMSGLSQQDGGAGGGLIKGSGIPCQVFLCQDPAMPGGWTGEYVWHA